MGLISLMSTGVRSFEILFADNAAKNVALVYFGKPFMLDECLHLGFIVQNFLAGNIADRTVAPDQKTVRGAA